MECEPRKRHRRAIWALLAVVGLFVGVAGSGGRAEAAFPGANGKIVFGSQHAGEDEIWVMNADGSGKTNLTRHDGAKIWTSIRAGHQTGVRSLSPVTRAATADLADEC